MEGFLGLVGDLNFSQGKSRVQRGKGGPSARRKREFMPDEKKDTTYWEKRRKNNEAAKRSREKRRLNDVAMESRLAALLEENTLLRAELLTLKLHFGLLSPGAYLQQAQAIQDLLQGGQPWSGPPFPEAETLPRDSCFFQPRPGLMADAAEWVYRDVALARGCLGSGKLMDLAPPGPPPTLTASSPKGLDSAFHASRPSAYLSSHSLDRCPSHIPLLDSAHWWGVWPPGGPGQGKGGGRRALEDQPRQPMSKACPLLLPPGSPCPSEAEPKLRAPSALPHKLRIKSKAPGGWEDNQTDTL
ncbi:NFIL3 like protein-like [Ornithorhynchus anatinus]|uniref:NFIL3 like protein-like n=1 Tax=Ornithorhynchus anatinus TaxID=9258 RepID=UPI0001554411|nr:NFIL3 like protein-like [Ornithorhynchus anatinus]